MNNYLIKLTIYVSQFEKQAVHLITADSEEAAELLALQHESHGDDAGFDSAGVWCDEDMRYRVLCTQELTATQADTLKGLL